MNLRKYLYLLSLNTFVCGGLYAQNPVVTVEQVAGSETIADAVDYTITSDKPITTMATIDITNPDAAIVFPHIRPSEVISNYLSKITYNGIALTNNANCRVSIYRDGSIIMPHSDNTNADGTPFYPVVMYKDADFTEEIGQYNGTGRNTNGAWKDCAKAFTLKRGYMCTVANDAAGTGYSHCYIANSQDLRIVLRKELAGKLGFFRIFRWQWPTKLGMSDARAEYVRVGTNSSWFYDWGAGTHSQTDAEYVPQRHHEAGQSNGQGYKGAWESWTNINASDNTCTHVLGQNEPDNTSGSGEVYTYVTSIPDNPRDKHGDYPLVKVAKDFLYSGKRIGTFACCNPNTGWVSEYVNWCRANNIRVDFIATHYYIGGQSPQGCIDRLWQLHNVTGLPVWATEWNNGANWTSESGFSTDSEGWYSWGSGDDQYKNGVWLRDVLVRADKPENAWLERLAVYNAVQSKRQIVENDKLTAGGEVLGKYHSGFAYNEANEYFMPWNHVAPKNFTVTLTNKSRKIVTLTWDHNNSKQSDSICIQRKTSNDIKWVTIKNMGMSESKSYTQTDTLSNATGLVQYRIADYDTDDKIRYSDISEVTIGSAIGNDQVQYGSLKIGNNDAVQVDFSESFATTPAIFMGVCTNVNTTLYPANLITSAAKAKFNYQILPWTAQATCIQTVDKAEEIPFLAIQDTTNFKFGDLDCETGTTKVKSTADTEVTFRTPFPEGVTPVVLTELRNPTYKSFAISARVYDITNTGFKVKLYTEEKLAKTVSVGQNLCYLAITPGNGTMYSEVDNSQLVSADTLSSQVYHLENGMDSVAYVINRTYKNTINHLNVNAGTCADGLYGTTYRLQNLLDANGEKMRFSNPLVFGGMQTLNYHSATILRHVSSMKITDKDDPDYGATTGVRIKRMIDGTSSTTDKNTKDFADIFGYVLLTNSASETEETKEETAYELIEATAVSGDIDGDGALTIADVTSLIDAYLNGETGTAFDVDGDGSVTISDITSLIDLYLNSSSAKLR